MSDIDISLLPIGPDTINRAGEIFRDPNAPESDKQWAIQHVENWRGFHQIPLHVFRFSLAERASLFDADSVVASRLKRMPTIMKKCARLRKLPLSEYQDIGGVRAIVSTPARVFELANDLESRPPEHFKLERRDNYISSPKHTGYRSIHLVYSYNPSSEGMVVGLQGFRIELQIRTQLQHTWATTNEIVGTFRQEDLKSGKGNPDWLRFFTLAGSVIARQEGGAPGPSVPSDPAVFETELSALKSKLNVFERVSAYNVAQEIRADLASEGANFYVLTFVLKKRWVTIRTFHLTELKKALDAYRRAELEHPNDDEFDTVFARAESLEELREAFPNYFTDTRNFLDVVYTPNEVEEIMRHSTLEPPTYLP